jgi:formylmethanofuran dehydrogenase subunit D
MLAKLNFVDSTGVMKSMMQEFLLNTGSTIEEGRLAKGGSKLTEEYTRECAVCDMNPRDFLGLGSPQKVQISTMDGLYSVAVYAYAEDCVPPGSIFMPRAIWSNVVVDPETFSTGSPLYKGSPVRVLPTMDEVLSAGELVGRLYMPGSNHGR